MQILIVGGGLGGISLAAFLEQRGLDYLVAERAASGEPGGYSLGVWSNTRALFEALHLSGALAAMGVPILNYDIVDARGRLLTHFSFEPLRRRFGMAYTAVDRAALHRLLASRVPARRVRTGCAVVQIAGSRVSFADGTQASFDVIVGADGVHSAVRAAAGLGDERPTGWRAWYARIDKGVVPANSMIECVGPSRCAALFDDPGERGLGVFFAAVRPAAHVAGIDPRSSPADALRQTFDGMAPVVREVLRSVRDEDFMPTDLSTVSLRRWHAGSVVLLGDAAHAFEPHTGLGASMAMEDASVLSGALADAAAGTTSLDQAFADYERQRRPAVALARRINTQLRTLAFIRLRAMRAITDRVIPWVPHRPFVRQYEKLLG